MRFAYIGDHEQTTVLGLSFVRGVPTEVTDDRAIRKLSHNCDFALFVKDGAGTIEVLPAELPVRVSTVEAKRRGRPPKAK